MKSNWKSKIFFFKLSLTAKLNLKALYFLAAYIKQLTLIRDESLSPYKTRSWKFLKFYPKLIRWKIPSHQCCFRLHLPSCMNDLKDTEKSWSSTLIHIWCVNEQVARLTWMCKRRHVIQRNRFMNLIK